MRTAPVVAIGALATLLPALTPAAAAAGSRAGTTAITVSTATTVSTTTVSTTVDALERYTRQKPHWNRCGAETPADLECATVKVPLDYSRPGGRTLDVAVSRTKATSAQDRRGVLLLNPGGPGGSGLDMPVWMAPELPDEVKKRYDLVGFDPRGVGRSAPVSCGLNGDELNWQRPYKAATFDRDIRWAETVAAKCRAGNGAVLPHLTTRNTARDMDVIRAVLGEKKISYLGYSYGTYLGAVYTQMFPRRTDRFVLDSAVDPERIWRGMIQVWAEGAEPAFTRWATWTAARDETYALGRTPAEVRATFWALVARADREPIVLDGTALTGDDIRAGRPMFFDVAYAAETVARLRDAAAGRTPSSSGRATPPAPVPPSFIPVGTGTGAGAGAGAGTGTGASTGIATGTSAGAVPADNMDAAFWSVVCADTRAWPRDPERYRRDAIRDKARYPLYGDFASHIKPCAFWGHGSEPATRVNNSVGALILQNEWDSQTPLVSGQGLRRAMKGARMVTVLGGQGHGVYEMKSCADATATAYLTTGRLPAADTVCRTPAAGAGHSLRLPLPTPRLLPGGKARF
ncbi:alpha/beta fold hydrolase [Streptomyces wedmorensis]|uniref:alpha/beta fold hydrolase n=1 Tax=Streptomyces wedmorensis TaxID=43759 RepID=UPI0037BC7F23